MKTLVIHPMDPTTDFLTEIYQDKIEEPNTEWKVIRYDMPDSELRKELDKHDRIIMLGHGFSGGLYGHSKIVINSSHANTLRRKKLVGIWCHADQFFNVHGLSGIFSGMMISEPAEAYLYEVGCLPEHIEKSNKIYSKAVRQSIFDPFPVDVFRSIYYNTSNPVIAYNRERFYYVFEPNKIERAVVS